MCRTLTLSLVPALLMVTWGEAHAERFLGFSGQGTAGSAGTYYIGAQTLGSPTITTLFGPATLAPSEDGFRLRDRFMPELGIPNVGKRGYSPNVGTAIQVFHGDNVQFWVSLDQTNWQLIPVNQWGNFFNSDIIFSDFGSNGTTAAATAGGVPAIGGVGLVVMVVAMLAAGGYILKRLQTASAA